MKNKVTHLPYYEALKDYPESQWIVFGTLTHKYDTSANNQLERFLTLMTAIGLPNKTDAKRLHWILRLENGHKSPENEELGHLHIHFLLSQFKLTNGHRHQYSYETLVKTIQSNWTYGRVDLPKYNPDKDGLGYILKARDDEGIAKSDEVTISRSLMTFLAKKKQYDKIDELGSQIYHNLKLSGTNVSYGEAVPLVKTRTRRLI
jgi:hypothetical protein